MEPALNYSAIDRFVHRLAFARPAVQLAAADIESVLFGSSYAQQLTAPPVFVTSLPRAGTTVLLEALSRLPGLASQTYRDMPFVLAPLLWSRISAAFQSRPSMVERAHGDGVEVGYDSPEAFEEVFWRTFWPGKYGAHWIDCWSGDDLDTAAQAFIEEHVRKVSALHGNATGREPVGYLSKNNGNLARLAVLGKMFPGASVVVPLREPVGHAASLLRQHRNFCKQQADDPFVRRYMHDIGHYDFGDLHRPVRFPTAAQWLAGRDAQQLDYWLAYWIAAFEYVLAQRAHVQLVSLEALACDPLRAFPALCGRLGLDDGSDGSVAQSAAGVFRAEPLRNREVVDCDPSLRRRAEEIYARLLTLACDPRH